MFSYPPRPWIPTRDNLVSDGSGSASAMSVQFGVRTGEQQQITIGGGATVVASRGSGPRVASRRRTRILIRSRHRLKSWGRSSTGAIDLGATGTSTSAGGKRADKKVQTLLTEVLRRCDSILEALSGTGGGEGCVILGVDGGINTVGAGGDTALGSVSTGGNGASRATFDACAGVVVESNIGDGNLATQQVIQGSVLTQARAVGARSFCLRTEASDGPLAPCWAWVSGAQPCTTAHSSGTRAPGIVTTAVVCCLQSVATIS
jgi:hypothetical protein